MVASECTLADMVRQLVGVRWYVGRDPGQRMVVLHSSCQMQWLEWTVPTVTFGLSIGQLGL